MEIQFSQTIGRDHFIVSNFNDIYCWAKIILGPIVMIVLSL